MTIQGFLYCIRLSSFAFILALFSLLGIPFAANAASSDSETVLVLKQQRYVIEIPGDNLTWLSGRFGVSKEAILKANPHVASRANPEKLYWLYLGEEITIPIFVATENKPLASVGTDDLIAVPARVVQEKNAQIGEMEKKLSEAQKQILSLESRLDMVKESVDRQTRVAASYMEENSGLKTKTADLENKLRQTNELAERRSILFYAALAAALALIFLLFIVIPGYQNKKNPPSSGNPEKKNPSTAENIETVGMKSASASSSSQTAKAEDILKMIQNLTGEELRRLADEPIARDELGNPVTIKKIREFMGNEKRANLDLKDHPLSEWQSLIEKNKPQQTASSPVAA